MPSECMKALAKLGLAHAELGLFGPGGFDLIREGLVTEWLTYFKRGTHDRAKRYVCTCNSCNPHLMEAVISLHVLMGGQTL